jgi:hypothetical protein
MASRIGFFRYRQLKRFCWRFPRTMTDRQSVAMNRAVIVAMIFAVGFCLDALCVLAQSPAIVQESLTTVIDQPQGFDTSINGQSRAILIGCGNYPHLSKDYQLQGPPNDVAITRELIQSERFGVEPENITVLVPGLSPDSEPTGANIRAAFENMCATAQSGEQVLILLAGHGCQVPNQNPDVDFEVDGLDEAFVPTDISGWDANHPPKPQELILDDEIGAWAERLSKSGARVFLIADCCHAGSINRGLGEPISWVRERRLPPIFSPIVGQNDGETSESTNDESEWEVPASVISLFAVPSRFAELEERMPPRSTGGVETVHGRLSFALNQVLRNAKRSLTYRELMQQVGWQYLAWGWNPRPYLEGGDLDREVLGAREWPTRSWITAIKESHRYRLNVGFLDQVAVGSIFELFPADRAEGSDVSLGFVKVSRVAAGECLAEPCAFDGRAAGDIANLPLGANAELVYRELGDARLPVALISATDETPNKELWAACEAALDNIFADRRRLVRQASPDETPQLFVVVGATHVWVQNGKGSVEGWPDSGSTAYALGSNPQELEPKIAGSLTMIARALNLVRLASPIPSESVLTAATERTSTPTLLGITIQKEHPPGSGSFVAVDDPDTIVLKDGDRVRIQVQNRSDRSLDLTGLVVESGFAINPIRLRRDGKEVSKRLPPNSEPAYFGTINISNTTFGLEHFILIGVEAGPEPEVMDFSYLRQNAPQAASEVAKPMNRSTERASGFRQLVESTTLDGAPTRGPGRSDEPGVVLRIPWRVLPPDTVPKTK